MIEAPHIVLLGAGASIAAYNDWGKIGNPLPSMLNIVDVLSLRSEVSDAGYDLAASNFEDVYDDLATSGRHPELKSLLEVRVYEYFSQLILPDVPTLYDYLILALREKDIIATFNWDPFLIQAYLRNERVSPTRRPNIAFLHGNVMLGMCERDQVKGINGRVCLTCGTSLTPSLLLYPVRRKDYDNDPLIRNEWAELRNRLGYGYYLTIFGYSAPKTDVEARRLLLDDWRKNPTLTLAQVDVIDIKSEDELERSWQDFFVKSLQHDQQHLQQLPV